MDALAVRDRDSRRRLFLEAAARLNILAPYIEKDFWVCWTLRRLFAIPELHGHLIFKGGTSLSKVYKVINRFSEDIDLTLGRELLGFAGDKDPDNARSRKKREALTAAMVQTCARFIQTDLLGMLRRSFADVLPGKDSGGEAWEVVADAEVADGQTLLFHYYDLAMLARSPIADSALADLKLLARVVEHKQRFFRCAWAHYETAVPGTLRLLPPAERLPELRHDYERMQPMIFEAAPQFDAVFDTLRVLETRINGDHTP